MSGGKKRQPAVAHFAGFVFIGDPERATAATVERLVQHVVGKLEAQQVPLKAVAR